MRRSTVSALFGVLVMLLVFGTAAPAYAHSTLEDSDPADGARVGSSPDLVRLTFDEPILDGPNQITVSGPENGEWQRDDTLRIEGEVVSAELATLGGAGEYTVDYRVVSLDGHPVSGSVGFTLTEPAGGAPVRTESAGKESGDGASEESAADSAGSTAGTGSWPWFAGGAVVVCAILVLLSRRDRNTAGK